MWSLSRLGRGASDVGKRAVFYKDRADGSPELHTRQVEEEVDRFFEVKLQRLDLSEIPLECGYSYTWIASVNTLRFVSVLNLGKCGLTQLPPEIATMTGLRRLRVEHNHLTWLPEPIEKLTELRVLSAYDNQLQTLPSGMYKLLQLRVLRLGGNKLTARHLFVLTNYDQELHLLEESLWEVHLRDNPLLVLNEIPQSFYDALQQARSKHLSMPMSAAELDVENCPIHSISQTRAVRIY